jgi:hypothetical protein
MENEVKFRRSRWLVLLLYDPAWLGWKVGCFRMLCTCSGEETWSLCWTTPRNCSTASDCRSSLLRIVPTVLGMCLGERFQRRILAVFTRSNVLFLLEHGKPSGVNPPENSQSRSKPASCKPVLAGPCVIVSGKGLDMECGEESCLTRNCLELTTYKLLFGTLFYDGHRRYSFGWVTARSI